MKKSRKRLKSNNFKRLMRKYIKRAIVPMNRKLTEDEEWQCCKAEENLQSAFGDALYHLKYLG